MSTTERLLRSLRRGLVGPCLTLLILLAPAPVDAAEICEGRVCIDGAQWEAGAQLDDKARKREARRNRKRKDATLSVEIRSGRGSVFVDGVWLAPAPISYVPLKPGRHDLEVRDGETVLARGVMNIPRKGGDVTVKIN